MFFYIDPGTGSMLFTVLIAVVSSLIYLARNLKVRLGAALRRNRKAEAKAEILPLVIFSDHRRYWTTFGPVCEELEKRQQPTLYLTESPDDPALERNFRYVRSEYIGEGSRAFARLNFLRAQVVFSTTPSLDVYQWKRSRDAGWYVHIPHAPNDITRYRMFGIDYYDAILLSNANQGKQVRELEKLRDLPAKELVTVGVPYLDAMKARLEREQEKKPEESKAREGNPETERTVLLAPSWGESGILKKFGTRILDALLATGYHLIIRPHPQSFSSEKDMLAELQARYPESPRLEWNSDDDNFDALSRSDILISDFSGVIFDYVLVFDRPVLYADTSFDPGPYDCWWLEEELWTFRTLPKLGMHLTEENLPELKDMIDRCIAQPVYREAREQARREAWAFEGEGAARTADYLVRKVRELETADGKKPDGNPDREGDTETPEEERKPAEGPETERTEAENA